MRYRIVLCGFSEFEYGAMHFSMQHPLTEHRYEYDIVDAIADADFAVVDADTGPAVKGVVRGGRVADSVFIGTLAPPDAAALVPRPLDVGVILNTLDGLIAARQSSEAYADTQPFLVPVLPTLEDIVVASPDFGMPSAPMLLDVEPVSFDRFDIGRTEPVFTDAPSAPTPVSRTQPAPSDAPRGFVHANQPAPIAQPHVPTAAQSAAKAAARKAARRARLASHVAGPGVDIVRDVLVLDGDEKASAHLCGLLERFGFTPSTVRNIPEASEHLSTRLFVAMFLDIALDGPGLALLEQIHITPVPLGHPPPAVLLVAAQSHPTDRVRAALAGIPAPLVKPLSRGDVARALEDCRVALPSDERRI